MPTALPEAASLATQRLQLSARGAVQGVGFRPFVYRMARELGLVGWVGNTPRGVSMELEGRREQLDAFVQRLRQDPPLPCRLEELTSS